MPVPIIVPLLVIGGFGLILGSLGRRRRTAAPEATPPPLDTDGEPAEPAPPPAGGYSALSPIETRRGYGQAKAVYDHAISPAVTDVAYVIAIAEWERVNGFPEFWESLAAKASKMGAAADVIQGYGGPPEPYAPPPPPPAPPGASPPPVETTAAEPTVTVEPAPPGAAVPGTGAPPAPPTPRPEDLPPLAAEEIDPEFGDPDGTIALARLLIARESGAGWKNDLMPDVAAWQRKVEIEADGKFGVGSLEMMAAEVGTLPRVRFFPKSTYTKAQGVAAARAAVDRIIPNFTTTLPAQAIALEVSRDAETGQGWPADPPPIPLEQRRIEQSVLQQRLDRLAAEDVPR